jgi:putative transposase
MDEAFVPINGARSDLWRAGAPDDNGRDILGQSRRKKPAAKKCCKKRRQGWRYGPRVRITDQRKSSAAAKREVLPGVEHRPSRSLNNRCENSHRPTRERARRLQRWKSPGHAQRFLAAYGPIASACRPRRPLLTAPADRQDMPQRFQPWRELTGTDMAAEGTRAVLSHDLCTL